MTKEGYDGLKIWASTRTLGILLAATGFGGIGAGIGVATGLLTGEPTELVQCERSEQRLITDVLRYEAYVEATKKVPACKSLAIYHSLPELQEGTRQ